MLRRTATNRKARRGVALLMTVFVAAITATVLLGIITTSRAQVTALQNTVDYERAQQLAGAGVHHALATLLQNPAFAGTIPSTEFPRGSGLRYSAEVRRTSPDTVIVTGVGVSGDVTRRLEVTVRI